MRDLGEAMTKGVSAFPDPGVLGTFISSHDASRLRAVTSSDSVAYNALVWQFMFDGIPITYYGESRKFLVDSPILINDKRCGPRVWADTPRRPTRIAVFKS
jgi:alpha-amylase